MYEWMWADDHGGTAVRSSLFPWLDGATTRVPKLFAVKEEGGAGEASFPALNTPSPEEWRAEVKARHSLRKQAA